MMASFQRSNSHDKVRRIVAEEGRTARNLIAWSVPLESKDDDGKSKCQTGGKSKRTIQGTHKTAKQNTTVDCKMTSSTTGDKHFDKSPTKTRHPRKVDLRARYWAFLFDNLRRAVDEIYVTCESDQSVVECKEVLMMLDNYVRDFKALIDWIQLQEKLEKTDAQSRPTSLAWEVKKMSPGRHVIPSPSTDRINVTSNARRSLNFGGSSGTGAAPRLAPTGVSWADKVKAHHTGSAAASDVAPAQSCPPAAVQKPSRRNERKDAEGWETVQRGRPVRSRSTAVMPKASLPTEALRSKDDSDKENVHLLPEESVQKSEFVGDEPSNTIESRPKDPVHSCDHPLAEKTQFTVSTLDDVKNSGSSFLPDNSVPTSEIPAVHIDTECVSVIQQADTPSLQASEDKFSAEKARIESEMDPSDISNVSAANLSMAEVLAKKEELADRLEKANEEAIASAIAEEEQLTREIEAEENNDINIETDNDSDFSASMGSGSVSFCGMNWNDVLADYEARESWRQNTSWGDIVEEEPARPPGHGIHMHEKLSSPSRKRTIAESKKKHEEKQMKAQQLREKLREQKTLKLQKLLEREKEVRKWKEGLLDQRRRMMEEKLLHAEFKREVQLQAIVKKAQEEEAKVNEIAFINTLEAQNKRHDVLSKLKEYEQRLNELQEERQRRQEEKQARDEAVQERKRALEAERQARVEELLMKRKEQEARIEQQRQEKEKAREDAARERARDREERLAALTAAQQEAMEELQKKIQLKHDESIRRHMEQIEQRKEKAAELSSGRHANTDYAPKLTPYERKKQCSLCNVLISSEVYLFSHIKGKKHQQAVRENSSIQGRELSDEEVLRPCKYLEKNILGYGNKSLEAVPFLRTVKNNILNSTPISNWLLDLSTCVFTEHLSLKKYVIDIVVESTAPPEPLKDGEERQKNKKKAKKIKARMNFRAKEYESLLEAKNSGSDSPYKAKLQRLAKDLLKQLQVQDSGSWASNKVSALDRTLGEVARILEKENVADQIAFQAAGGLTALEHILQVVVPVTNVNPVSRIPPKSLCNAINVYNLTCNNCSENCTDVLFSNKITFLMDLLIHQLTVYVPDENNAILGRNTNKQVFEGLTTGLLKVSAAVFGCLIANRPDGNSQPTTPKISTQEMKSKPSQGDAFNSRVQDLISYVVNIGLIDKLCGCFLSVQGPVDENPKMATFLQHAAGLLQGMCTLCFAVTGSLS
ncbi:S phase cyclin A-associated protein in the endoplasmic reticulum isoform 5-T5 [Dama dama]|uniref:S phase cyclin A-associated protein in the endoplasmic reticulum isoform X5 n=1 Tax=Dama dama TaxID=30532 RepID=UPI002A35D904|nr:S phase cyclin A-associated protein in the endoplasmic reticulum isoform X5 [Dama dama]